MAFSPLRTPYRSGVEYDCFFLVASVQNVHQELRKRLHIFVLNITIYSHHEAGWGYANDMEECILQRQKRAFLDSYTPSARVRTPEERALESAIKASVRRNPTYTRDITDKQKKEVLDFWWKELVKRGKKYLSKNQGIETYVKDVLEMKESINNEYKKPLSNTISEGIRIAHCQKSLSIYLKYMWCQGIATATPPACPIDRAVLTHCGIFDIAWTRLDEEKDFRKILKKIETVKDNSQCHTSIAEWELCIFNLSNN